MGLGNLYLFVIFCPRNSCMFYFCLHPKTVANSVATAFTTAFLQIGCNRFLTARGTFPHTPFNSVAKAVVKSVAADFTTVSFYINIVFCYCPYQFSYFPYLYILYVFFNAHRNKSSTGSARLPSVSASRATLAAWGANISCAVSLFRNASTHFAPCT